jgi:hypothetical protein
MFMFISLALLVGFLSRKSQASLALMIATTAIAFLLLLATRNPMV